MDFDKVPKIKLQYEKITSENYRYEIIDMLDSLFSRDDWLLMTSYESLDPSSYVVFFETADKKNITIFALKCRDL